MTATIESPSIVIESGRREAAVAQTAALEGAGFTVTHCGGPEALPGGTCPLVAGVPCRWIAAADVVVHDLDLDEPKNQEVLQALRRSHPDTPIVLELPAGAARQHASLLEGCHVVYPFDMERLVAAVDAAARAHRPGRTVLPLRV